MSQPIKILLQQIVKPDNYQDNIHRNVNLVKSPEVFLLELTIWNVTVVTLHWDTDSDILSVWKFEIQVEIRNDTEI